MDAGEVPGNPHASWLADTDVIHKQEGLVCNQRFPRSFYVDLRSAARTRQHRGGWPRLGLAVRLPLHLRRPDVCEPHGHRALRATTHYSLLTTHTLLTHYSLLTTHYSSLTAHCLLLTSPHASAPAPPTRATAGARPQLTGKVATSVTSGAAARSARRRRRRPRRHRRSGARTPPTPR